ncbi:MAG: Signal peptidase-like protein [Rhizobacter sp.]|nr:Signal peptidase-like protein [Chlorobiales bacterium]
MACVGCSSSSGCSTGGCGTGISLQEYLKSLGIDDEANTETESNDYDVFEVEFKAARKDFFRDIRDLSLKKDDRVVVQVDSGFDLGRVVTTGKVVAIKMQQKRLERESPEILEILRKATPRDLEVVAEIKASEAEAAEVCQMKIKNHGLDMKFVDVEFRFDMQKVSLYYTAEQRVDFRELVRDLAAQYRTRIQLIQISAREEAKRLGGIGTCGRTLCCSTWLTDFEQVSTDAAKPQNLPFNLSRLSGQCGRLKCCLNYELDGYLQALKKFPSIDSRVKTEYGMARIEKIDIFKEEVWLHHENSGSWERHSLQNFNQKFAKK